MPEESTENMSQETTATNSLCSANASESLRTRLVPTETDLGKRVVFCTTSDKERFGTLRYYGRLEFAEGLWCGVELDEPTGKNNGSVRGIRYFSCEQHHGIFVLLSRVELDTSRRPSKSRAASISRSASQSSLSRLPAPQKKLSVPAVTSYRPSKTLPHLQRRQKGGGLKKSSSEWDLLGSRSSAAESSEGLSSGRKMDRGSYSDLKSAVSNSGEGLDAGERKRRLFRPTVSCMNLITIKTSKKCLLPGEEKKEEERMRPQHQSISSWPRTSTPQQSRGCSSSSSNSSISDSDHTLQSSSSSSSASPVSTKVEHSPTPNLSPTLTPATAERAFVVSPDDVFTSSSNSSAMRAPAPAGLTTPAVQAMENMRVTGGESSSPYLDVGQSPNRRYHNKQSGMATLNHPLRVANGHGLGGQIFPSKVEGEEDSVGSKNSYQDLVITRLVQLEHELRETQAEIQSQRTHFSQQLQAVENRLQRQLMEAEKRHQQQLQRLTVDHEEEMRVLQMAYQLNIKEMWRDGELRPSDTKS